VHTAGGDEKLVEMIADLDHLRHRGLDS